MAAISIDYILERKECQEKDHVKDHPALCSEALQEMRGRRSNHIANPAFKGISGVCSAAPWELAASPTGTHGRAAAWATAFPSYLAGTFCSELCKQAQRQEQISVPTDTLSLHIWAHGYLHLWPSIYFHCHNY